MAVFIAVVFYSGDYLLLMRKKTAAMKAAKKSEALLGVVGIRDI